MKITAERFEALLDGSATNVIGEETVVGVEAFSAERRGEDPLLAVMANLPNVTIVESHRVEASRPSTRGVARKTNALVEMPTATKAKLTEQVAQVFARLNGGTLFGIYWP